MRDSITRIEQRDGWWRNAEARDQGRRISDGLEGKKYKKDHRPPRLDNPHTCFQYLSLTVPLIVLLKISHLHTAPTHTFCHGDIQKKVAESQRY